MNFIAKGLTAVAVVFGTAIGLATCAQSAKDTVVEKGDPNSNAAVEFTGRIVDNAYEAGKKGASVLTEKIKRDFSDGSNPSHSCPPGLKPFTSVQGEVGCATSEPVPAFEIPKPVN